MNNKVNMSERRKKEVRKRNGKERKALDMEAGKQGVWVGKHVGSRKGWNEEASLFARCEGVRIRRDEENGRATEGGMEE